MKSAKKIAVVACAGLLTAAIVGSARHTYAQPPQQEGWSFGGSGSADASSSPDAKTPLNIAGCWRGSVKEKPDGTGTATFAFAQNGSALNGTDSGFDFEWSDGNFAHGNITGTVSSKGFVFTGSAGAGCPISGSGTGTASAISGKFTFGGKCGKFVPKGTFSIAPGACS
jgi:hypothetical protein